MKKGVSLVSLIVVIVVMSMIAGVVVLKINDSTELIKFSTFVTEIYDIQNAVDEYYYRYNKYPVKNEYVFDVSNVDTKFISQFSEEEMVNSTISFKIIDLSAIGINKIEYGKGKNLDIYALSEKTGNIYYLKGFEYEDELYYTLTKEVYDIIGIENNNEFISGNDVKISDVIFTPSTLEYTNQPITVTAKLPLNAGVTSITTSDNKSVSSEAIEGNYKIYKINETSENADGNYTIEVNYIYNGMNKIAKYSVTTFDNTTPQITTTTSIKNGIKTVNISATDDLSGVKVTKYEEVEIEDDLHFENYGKVVKNYQITLSEFGAYTIYVEDEAGNSATVVEIGESAVPAKWQKNIDIMYNKVPIPKGFVASHVKGENTKNGGLVIYEGTDEVTDENVQTAWTTRNQYVWVPVEDFSKFVRESFSGKVDSDVLGSGYWEVVLDTFNMPLEKQDVNYMTSNTLAEVQAMYESVKEYKGFYIARYEAGIDKQRTSKGTAEMLPRGTNVYSRMNKIPYTYILWTWNGTMNEDTNGGVEIARSIYPAANINASVVSTLTYGVQWDAILKWWLDVKVKDINGNDIDVNNSKTYGNYRDHEIKAIDLNDGALVWDYTANSKGSYVSKDSTTLIYPKQVGQSWALSTGALKAAKVNNIYDMAGNMLEWTMEGRDADKHISRGGHYKYEGGDSEVEGDTGRDPVSDRIAYTDYASASIAIRVAIYIKK